MADRFEIKLVLEQLKGLVKSKPNHSDFEFYKELIVKLEKYLACDMCDKPCGNSWCITEDKDEKK